MSDAPILDAVRALRFLAAAGAADPLLVVAVPGSPDDTFARRLLDEGWAAGVGCVEVEDVGAAEAVVETVRGRATPAVHLAALDRVLAEAVDDEDAGQRVDRFVAALDRLATAGCAVVWSVRETDPGAARFPEPAHRVRRAVAERARLVHLPAPAIPVLEALGVPVERAVIAPHPGLAGWHRTGGSRAAARFALGLAADETVFVVPGPPPGSSAVSLLLDAWREAGGAAEARRLVVASAATPDPEGDRLAAALDVAPAVVATIGPSTPDRLAQLCRAADVAVLPARDPFDQDAVLVALEHGLPVVAPTVAPELDVLDLLDDRVACRFAPGDAAGMADALRRAPLLASAATAAAGREIAARHDPAGVSRAFVSELRRRLAGA